MMTTFHKLISFVIPCYRSEKTIEPVIEEIIRVVSEKKEYDYEIICVNDCSPDGVGEVIRRLAEKNLLREEEREGHVTYQNSLDDPSKIELCHRLSEL